VSHSLRRRPRTDLAHYVPQDGVEAINLAEAAEVYYTRVKDPTRLYEAVEWKLTEQRRFVLWWDQQDRAPGPGRGKKGSQTGDGFSRLADFALDDGTVHRWRERLKTDDDFADALKAAEAKCLAVCEFNRGQTDQRGASGTGDNEWFTPAEYIEAARKVLGAIDLDPATHPIAQRTIRATRYYTKSDDGLTQPWTGRVWCNPPYTKLAEFADKLVDEYTQGRMTAGIFLTHNYTDTGWFHTAAAPCAAICFTRGRIKFTDPKGEIAAPTQGQAFFYYGSDPGRFLDYFRPIGLLLVPPT
jgi:phage N-6-adenine-methyltransferase